MRLRKAVESWVAEEYGHVTLAHGFINLHDPEGPPALIERLERDVEGVLRHYEEA